MATDPTSKTKPYRLFVAVSVPDEVADLVEEALEPWRRALLDVRWTPRTNWHVTLRFLGSTDPRSVPWIGDRLTEVASDTAPFERGVRGLGAFPSLRRPRIIWVGLAGDITALKQLQSAVETATVRKEEREFHPHFTIGRVREGRRPKLDLDPWKDHPFGEWQPRELLLMQSKLSPKGATHSVIARFTLAP